MHTSTATSKHSSSGLKSSSVASATSGLALLTTSATAASRAAPALGEAEVAAASTCASSMAVSRNHESTQRSTRSRLAAGSLWLRCASSSYTPGAATSSCARTSRLRTRSTESFESITVSGSTVRNSSSARFDAPSRACTSWIGRSHERMRTARHESARQSCVSTFAAPSARCTTCERSESRSDACANLGSCSKSFQILVRIVCAAKYQASPPSCSGVCSIWSAVCHASGVCWNWCSQSSACFLASGSGLCSNTCSARMHTVAGSSAAMVRV
mmetsp:Transcript_33044/g.82159  ORF Transcript_33044/g.82159 Transcript_33044/m.82159 type:complete len:272 (-) Transcript_33044:118-933(-)